MITTPGYNPFPDTCDTLPIPADHTAWLLERRNGLGSSDCSAVLGLNQYTSPYELWLDKTGQVPLESADNEAMQWGRDLEPLIRQRTAERLGLDVMEIQGLVSKRAPWQRMSLDGYFPDTNQLLECKNTSAYLADQWAADQVPDHAELQTMHSLWISGAESAIVAGLINGNRLVTRTVYRNEELIELIQDIETEFWERSVLGGQRPELIGSDSEYQALVARGSDNDGQPVQLDGEQAIEAIEWANMHADAAADVKDANDRKARARNNLLLLGGSAPAIDVQVGWTEEPDPITGLPIPIYKTLAKLQRGVVAWKRFEADHPDIADTTRKKVDVLDTEAIKSEHPELYRAYQSRSIRLQMN